MAATTDAELANEGVSNNAIAGYTARDDEDMNVEHPRVSPGYFPPWACLYLPGVSSAKRIAKEAGGSCRRSRRLSRATSSVLQSARLDTTLPAVLAM